MWKLTILPVLAGLVSANECQNGGVLNEDNICDCTLDYENKLTFFGENCEQVAEILCFNDGRPEQNDAGDWLCNCQSGFTGDNCQAQYQNQRTQRNSLDLSLIPTEATTTTTAPVTTVEVWVPCEELTCFNNGTLTYNTDCTEETVDDGSCNLNCACDCDDSYRGDECEIYDPCYKKDLLNLCGDHGACNLGKCYCAYGYSGNRCQNYDPLCINKFCFNGGTCSQGICDCAPGFIGENCGTRDTCYNVNCGQDDDPVRGKCNNGDCVCSDCYYGNNCELEDLCCNVDCGMYGTCEPTTGSCDFCSNHAIGIGDVHYFSFDGTQTDYQGHCSYQLSGMCDNAVLPSNLPWFRLIGRQQKKEEWDIPYVTWIYGWTMEYIPVGSSDKVTISFDLNNGDIIPKYNVNGGEWKYFGINVYYPEFKILTTGVGRNSIYFGIADQAGIEDPQHNFLLQIQWSPQHLVMLHANCQYQGLLCGLMGFYDKDASNDWMLPDGTTSLAKPAGENLPTNLPLWSTTFTYGDNYFIKTGDEDSCSENGNYTTPQFTCSDADVAEIQSATYCGMLDLAPFKNCDIDMEFLKIACLYDLCAVGRDNWQETLCMLLSHHSDKCHDAGRTLGDWRTPDLCPVFCPLPNQEYKYDATKCRLHTENCQPETTEVCHYGTEGRCECNSDFPIWDPKTNSCTDYCQPFKCIGVDCGDHGTCNVDGQCVCDDCFSGEFCEIEDKCCSGNVDCGATGTCEPETGNCLYNCGFARGVGDTHYHSFDGRQTDFQGHCTYQLSGTCEQMNITATEATPYFKLLARQQKRLNPPGKFDYVTYLHGWKMIWEPFNSNQTVEIFWDMETINHPPTLRINGIELVVNDGFNADLQLLVTDKTQTLYFGITDPLADLETDFKIKFQWDRNHGIFIYLNCAYTGQVCGMLGLYDNDESNDWTTSNLVSIVKPPQAGKITKPTDVDTWKAAHEFGLTWAVEDADLINPLVGYPACDAVPPNPPGDCDGSKIAIIESSAWCGKLLAAPFDSCDLDKTFSFNSCVYDLCAEPEDMWEIVVCDILTTQETACNNAGFDLGIWRNQNVCPYNFCDTNSCGANGLCDYVSESCICDSCYSGTFCKNVDLCCLNNVECGLFGTCDPSTGLCDTCSGYSRGLGDTHYYSFDGRQIDFQGHCTYQLSGTCEEKNVTATELTPYFKLLARQQKRLDPPGHTEYVTYIHGWKMIWEPFNQNTTIEIFWDMERINEAPIMRVDGQEEYLSLEDPYPEYQIDTTDNGQTIYFGLENAADRSDPDFNFKIKLNWNRQHGIFVYLHCAYSEQVCGMLGDFDYDESNDWTTRDLVEIVKPPQINKYASPSDVALWNAAHEFGITWAVEDADLVNPLANVAPACDIIPPRPPGQCSDADIAMFEGPDWCGRLLEAPFSTDCPGLDKDFSFRSCIYDLCATPKPNWESVICDVLANDAALCADINQPVGNWRTPTFCPINWCDTNDCGANGICDYKQQQCVCDSCYSGEFCEIADFCCLNNTVCGPYGSCDPATGLCDRCTGMSYGTGDTHYYSFDGFRSDFQGHCTYQLSGTCEQMNKTASTDAPYFKLLARQQKRIDPPGFTEYVTYLHGWKFIWQPVNSNETVEIFWDMETINDNPIIRTINDGEDFIPDEGLYDQYQIYVTDQSHTIYFGITQESETADPDMFFKAKLVWNREHGIYLHLDCNYEDQVCGMMGTFDYDYSNDWMTPDLEYLVKPAQAGKGTKPTDGAAWTATHEFGNSWNVIDADLVNPLSGSSPSCDAIPPLPNVCTDEQLARIMGNNWCGRLLNGPFFNDCPLAKDQVFDFCVYDLCVTAENLWEATICEILANEESRCANSLYQISPWRSSSFCPRNFCDVSDCGANQSCKQLFLFLLNCSKEQTT